MISISFFIFLIFILLSFQNGVSLIILSGGCCPLLRNDLEKDEVIILEKFPIILMENMSDIVGFELLGYAEDCISVSVLRCLDLFDAHTFFLKSTHQCVNTNRSAIVHVCLSILSPWCSSIIIFRAINVFLPIFKNIVPGVSLQLEDDFSFQRKRLCSLSVDGKLFKVRTRVAPFIHFSTFSIFHFKNWLKMYMYFINRSMLTNSKYLWTGS